MVATIEGASLEAVKDATTFAFYGEDFTVVEPNDADPFESGGGLLIKAAGREKSAWDSSAGSMVEVAELHFLMYDKFDGRLYPQHRVSVEWDGGEYYEIILENGELIQEEGDTKVIKEKIVRALSAASGIV